MPTLSLLRILLMLVGPLHWAVAETCIAREHQHHIQGGIGLEAKLELHNLPALSTTRAMTVKGVPYGEHI